MEFEKFSPNTHERVKFCPISRKARVSVITFGLGLHKYSAQLQAGAYVSNFYFPHTRHTGCPKKHDMKRERYWVRTIQSSQSDQPEGWGQNWNWLLDDWEVCEETFITGSICQTASREKRNVYKTYKLIPNKGIKEGHLICSDFRKTQQYPRTNVKTESDYSLSGGTFSFDAKSETQNQMFEWISNRSVIVIIALRKPWLLGPG